MRALAIVAASLTLAILIFFASIGAIFMFTTERIGTVTETCPNVVKYEDGSQACVVRILDDEQPIMIQRTVDATYLQKGM